MNSTSRPPLAVIAIPMVAMRIPSELRAKDTAMKVERADAAST
jgi:hypothetical protein